ncbi:MAG: hypothetical protein ABI881_16335 [Betaproteobacteria bacterium]
MMPARRIAVIGVAALVVAACGLTAGTRITASEGEPKHVYRKIAVVAMSASRAERKVFDDAFVARLGAAGVDGMVGDRYIEDAAVANGIEPVQAMRAAGADAIMYVWLRGESDDLHVEPSAGGWGWLGPAASWYPSAQSAQAMTSKFELRLYDIDTQGLAWSGYSTTYYPKSLDVDAPKIADAVVGELARRGFIARR